MSQIQPCSFSLDILKNCAEHSFILFLNLLLQIYNYLYLRVFILEEDRSLVCLMFSQWKVKSRNNWFTCVIILKIKRRMLTHKSRLFLIFPSHNPSANNGREQRRSWRWMQTNINRHCLCLSLILFDYNISLFNHGTILLPKKQCNFILMLTTTVVFPFFLELKSSLSKSA